MLNQELIAEIHSMLGAKNYSQRAIARRLGVSRGAVQAVARVKCQLYAPLLRAPGEEVQPPPGLHRRCPGCSGKVQMPCLACYLRKRRRKNE